jgi:competence protein ComEA
MVLGLILAIAALRNAGTAEPIEPAPPAIASINPNNAPWWELMVLPGIGETTARKIVEYREGDARRNPVFREPADLEPVPGIGPKSIQRIGPYLRFAD